MVILVEYDGLQTVIVVSLQTLETWAIVKVLPPLLYNLVLLSMVSCAMHRVLCFYQVTLHWKGFGTMDSPRA